MAQIYFLRGLCLEESGLIPAALEDMHQARARDPDLKAAALFIGDHGPKINSSPVSRLKISPLVILQRARPEKLQRQN